MARPSWQHDDCPAWCDGGHRENDQSDDWVHHSAGITIPVITRELSIVNRQLHTAIEASTFELGLTHLDGQSETWLYLGDGTGQHINVSLESARRIEHVLRRVLNGM